MNKDVVTRMEPQAVEARQNTVITPMDMVARAVESGASIETLERLMDLRDRFEKSEARKAFDAAMSAARADIPVIIKNREVQYEHANGGGKTSYRHEDLGEIVRAVGPILAQHGLSFRWRTESPLNAPVSVTCIIAHRDGHSEENTLCAGRDSSGKKNDIQSIGSTITYLQRYTLKAALGLAASSDDDGKTSEASEAISAEQATELRNLLADFDLDETRFLKLGKLERLEDLEATEFEGAVQAINRAAAKARNVGDQA